MRVPLEWLKGYVAIRLPPEKLAHRLTMAGLEVVAIERVDGEPVLDMDITPNRADCLSIIGVAREVAVLTGQRLKRSPAAGGAGSTAQGRGRRRAARASGAAATVTIRVDDHTGCQRYTGRLIEGVRMGFSPAWMQRRLIACGARPINIIVDITNYVLLEYGQPLHAFDFARLSQGTIVVRRARPGEPITTLDGVRRTLSPEILVVADSAQAVAVAGVMGGVGSEVTPQTRQVLLESALFDPVTVRRAARQLGLVSESSYRFERGVDPVGVEAASARASVLMRELAGGKEVAVQDAGTSPPRRTAITVETQRLNRWLGTRLELATIRSTLKQLSCRVASSGMSASMRITPPSFRQDLTQAVDLYEEVARVVGYDRIPTAIPVGSIAAGPTEKGGTYERTQALRRLCASLGLSEVITWSLVSEVDLSRYGFSAAQAVRLSNPLSQEHACLRPSLLIGLLQAVRRNVTHGATGVRLFEVGSVAQPTALAESVRLGIALSGWWLRDWRQGIRCDFWVLKGLLQALLGRLCGGAPQFRSSARPWAEPGECAEIHLGGRPIGVTGKLAAAIGDELDLRQAAWVAELDVSGLSSRPHIPSPVQAPAALPSVKRDLSVLVGQETPFEVVDRTIRDVTGAAASRVELIDRFDKGEQLAPGTYSLTFSIEYRNPSRTLTAAEVDALHQRIGQTLTAKLKARIR